MGVSAPGGFALKLACYVAPVLVRADSIAPRVAGGMPIADRASEVLAAGAIAVTGARAARAGRLAWIPARETGPAAGARDGSRLPRRPIRPDPAALAEASAGGEARA